MMVYNKKKIGNKNFYSNKKEEKNQVSKIMTLIKQYTPKKYLKEKNYFKV